MIDTSGLQMWLAALIGWLDRQEREAFAYFFEETVSCARIAGLPATSAGAIRRSTAPVQTAQYYERAAC